MLAAMRPGSVVVDLAAESGGNVEGAVPGEEVVVRRRAGCSAWPTPPSAMPVDASRLYAKNVTDLLAADAHRGGVRASTWTTRCSPAPASSMTAWSGTRPPLRCLEA